MAKKGNAISKRKRIASPVGVPQPPPSDVSTLFLMEILAVTLVAATILGSLYFLKGEFGNVFNATANPSPLGLFVGNGVLLSITTVLLSVAVVTALSNVRYLVAVGKPYRTEAVVGLVLALLSGVVIAVTLYQYYSDPERFQAMLQTYLIVQGLLSLVLVFYSAWLKSELLQAVYEFSTWGAVVELKELNQSGSSSDAVLRRIVNIERMRESELRELRRELDTHLKHLRDAGSSVDHLLN